MHRIALQIRHELLPVDAVRDVVPADVAAAHPHGQPMAGAEADRRVLRKPVDVIVTYADRWMWDITMYMIEINIELHDPETNYVFASGKSYRTSLVRKEPDEMVDEVFRDMFKGKIELPEKKVEESKGEDES